MSIIRTEFTDLVGRILASPGFLALSDLDKETVNQIRGMIQEGLQIQPFQTQAINTIADTIWTDGSQGIPDTTETEPDIT